MKAYPFSILGLILFLISCKPSDSSGVSDGLDSTALKGETTVTKKSTVAPIRNLIRYAKVDRLRMRATPDIEGEVLVTLKEGDIVEWTGSISEQEETIQLFGKQITAALYEVVFIGLKYRGWVFGGALTANFPMALLQDHPKKKVGKGAYKAGPFNLFELADGRPLVLRDNDSQIDEYFGMEYHSILEPEGWYQIKGYGYEYHFWLVLNPNTGKLTRTIGTLKPSPDRNWMTAYSADMTAGFDFNGIQIFKNHGDSLELILERSMDTYEPAGFKWVEETKLQVDRASPQADGTLKEEPPTFYTLGDQGWAERTN
ncbi:MAG: hypothetical protein AAF598_10945 [Bacteroidota bacterium]